MLPREERGVNTFLYDENMLSSMEQSFLRGSNASQSWAEHHTRGLLPWLEKS